MTPHNLYEALIVRYLRMTRLSKRLASNVVIVIVSGSDGGVGGQTGRRNRLNSENPSNIKFEVVAATEQL